MNTCMTPVTVQPYGGGSRWYCPTCDTQQRAFGPPVAYWTNGTPPTNQLCPNQKKTIEGLIKLTKIQRIHAKGVRLDIW